MGVISAWISPQITKHFFQSMSDSYSSFAGLSNLNLFLSIFIHNAAIAAGMFLFGIIFGIFPVILIFFNGYSIGLVSYLLIEKVGLRTTLIGLLPHGIFEIPAILLAASLGLRLGIYTFNRIFRKTHEDFKPFFFSLFYIFIMIVLPILFIASFVETFITQALLLH